MPGSPQDRRQGDRRRGDRRADDGRPGQPRFTGESVFDPSWMAQGEPSPAPGGEDDAATRIYRTYAAARAAFGVALVGSQAAGNVLGARVSVELALVCMAYAVQAITLWLLPGLRRPSAPPGDAAQRRRQWLSTIGVDLLAFGSLHLLAAGASFNYAALLVLPVLMAGVLTQRVLALGTAAGVTLMLLLVAWRSGETGGNLSQLMLQSGLAGLGLFVIALLSGELASRLVREQQAARGSLELARQQAQLNRLVIEEMVDGVLVVDQHLRVRAANPAARTLLAEVGLSPPAPFGLHERQGWATLARAVGEALDEQSWPEAGRDLTLEFAEGHRRTLRVRMRFMLGRALAVEGEVAGEQFAVLLLEDVRTAQARLRQEKLAAMGRVSAGIAHEIRNPLAAIAQANALLLEDGLPASQQRLARMVADNVERLKRIVDDVMALAAGADQAVGSIDASAEIGAAADEWARTVGLPLGAGSRLRTVLPGAPLAVTFDAEHLRRVLVNLLDNARRHAGEGPGAIEVELTGGGGGPVRLSVASDGPPIAAEVERHLFEPFFSTRSRGSGLGLYICRELCERYGASIEYRARPAGAGPRNAFVVTLRRGAAAPDVALSSANGSQPASP